MHGEVLKLKCRGLLQRAGGMLAAAALCGFAMVPGLALAEDAPVAAEKSETVYVYANPDGSVKSTEVTTVLRNPDGESKLADVSSLSDIEAKDDKTYSGSAGSIVWNAEGDNITYTGQTNDEAPVSMRVTYTLDGQEIAPEKLLGKSGKVTIRFDFENRSDVDAAVRGVTQTIYTPFTCVTALMLDGKTFKNVTVENAKVIDDGDDVIVAGYAMPGLKESLGPMAEDSNVPDHFTVTADVADFKLKSTMTIVTAGLMSDINSDELGIDDLDGVGALSYAMGQLIDGSETLSTGLDALANGMAQLSDGTDSLTLGAGTLGSGIYALAYGTDDAPGLEAAAAGASELVGALEKLDASLKALADAEGGLPAAAAGLNALAESCEGEAEVVAGAQAELMALLAANPELPHENLDKLLQDGMVLSASVTQLAPGVQAASDGVLQASAALSEIASSAQSLPEGIMAAVDAAAALYAGAVELEGGASQLEEAAKQLADGAHSAADGSKELTQGMQTFNDEGVSQLEYTLDHDYGGLLDRVNALSDAAKSYTNFAGITDGTTGSVKFVIETSALAKD